jgi:hypothetical protein
MVFSISLNEVRSFAGWQLMSMIMRTEVTVPESRKELT